MREPNQASENGMEGVYGLLQGDPELVRKAPAQRRSQPGDRLLVALGRDSIPYHHRITYGPRWTVSFVHATRNLINPRESPESHQCVRDLAQR